MRAFVLRSLSFVTLAGLFVAGANGCSSDTEQASEAAPKGREARAIAAADEFVAEHGAELTASEAALEVRTVALDEQGQAHVRMRQFHAGVPVLGGEIIAHVDASNKVVSVTDGLRKLPRDLPTSARITQDDAVAVARAVVNAPEDAETAADLFVYTPPRSNEARLVHRVHVTAENDEMALDRVVLVDARDGSVVRKYDNLHTAFRRIDPPPASPASDPSTLGTGKAAVGSAETLYSGQVSVVTEILAQGGYGANDPTRGNMHVTNMSGRQFGSGKLFVNASNEWGDGTAHNPETAGVEALYGAQVTWDFYNVTFGRQGIKNDGAGALSRVHFGKKFNNAFWSDACNCMTYGDGDGSVLGPLVALDVAAHEMTHGVTSATAALVYDGESGGLNESMSDIFATMVEFYAAAQNPQSPKTPNYWIGEDVYTPGQPGDALRYMDDPSKDGMSIDHYTQYTNDMDVHFSSGLPNYVFYLLSEGGTHKTSKQAVPAIGRDKAAAIFYRALVAYMTPSTTFSEARKATLSAAKDLYGSNADEVAAVAAAWSASGVE